MKYAVAILYEDFPRYDHVKADQDLMRYYDGDIEVAVVALSSTITMRPQLLMIDFVDASNTDVAFDQIKERIRKHILLACTVQVPT